MYVLAGRGIETFLSGMQFDSDPLLIADASADANLFPVVCLLSDIADLNSTTRNFTRGSILAIGLTITSP